MEAENPPMGGTADRILDFLQPEKRSSWLRKTAAAIEEIERAGIRFDPMDDIGSVKKEIRIRRGVVTKKANRLAHFMKLAKEAKLIPADEAEDEYPIQVTAAPAPPAVPPGGAADAPPAGGEGAPMGDAGLEGIEGMGPADAQGPGMGMDDMGGGGGMGLPPMGGGGGGGGMPPEPGTPGDQLGAVQQAISQGSSIGKQHELLELKRYLKLLEKKKRVLEELQEIKEKRREEEELFSHVTNKDYEGFDRIQVLPPEQMELEGR